MKLLILIPVVFLSGCFYQTVTGEEIKSANIICNKANSYVVEIVSRFDGVEEVVCSDMNTYFINHDSIK